MKLYLRRTLVLLNSLIDSCSLLQPYKSATQQTMTKELLFGTYKNYNCYCIINLVFVLVLPVMQVT